MQASQLRELEMAGTEDLLAGKVEKGYVGALLYALQDQLVSIGRDVEVANVEVGGKIGELALSAGFEIDEPKIFVLDFAAEQDERVSSGEEGDVTSSASERERREYVGGGLRCDGFQSEGGADVRSGVDDELAVG